MPSKTHRPFSTASLASLAGELNESAEPDHMEAILHKLLQIDQEIHADLSAMRADLSRANDTASRCQMQLEEECALRRRVEAERDGSNDIVRSLREQLTDANMKAVTPLETIGNCSCSSGAEAGRDRPSQPERLTDLLNAREEAYRNQQTLVERLKCDNRELKSTYDKLWDRYQILYNKRASASSKDDDRAVDDRIEHLSLRVHHAGQAACNVASQVEERLQLTAMDIDNLRVAMSPTGKAASRPRSGLGDCALVFEDSVRASRRGVVKEGEGEEGCLGIATGGQQQHDLQLARRGVRLSSRNSYVSDDEQDQLFLVENERFSQAGLELMKTLHLQQEAHERLRTTVVELTKELERLGPEKAGQAKKTQQELQEKEAEYSRLQAELREKDGRITELNKQLNKVVAEYEAVSIAHSYSNAELSKIRATTRGKTKLDRPHGHGNGVLEGVENLLHPRKNYFR